MQYLGSFVDLLLVLALVDEHGGAFAILQHGRVDGVAGGQRQGRLLQGVALQSAALRAHPSLRGPPHHKQPLREGRFALGRFRSTSRSEHFLQSTEQP